MNEVALSDDLNVITAEINSYKQVAGQAIFEIGRRLKHVKENDLAHGEFGEWLESIDMTPRHAQRFMKVYEELPNTTQVSHLGIRALYEMATLPTEEREKEHTLSSGETKTVDEMTSRELEEVKRQLKAEQKERERLEREAEQAQKSEEIALRKLEEAESKEPEVITQEVVKEVVPEDVKRELEHMRKMVKLSDSANKELREELDTYKLKETTDYDEKAAEWELKKLQNEADRNATQVRLSIKQLNNQIAISKYMYEAISVSSDYEKNEMKKEIGILKDIISGIEASLQNRKVMN